MYILMTFVVIDSIIALVGHQTQNISIAMKGIMLKLCHMYDHRHFFPTPTPPPVSTPPLSLLQGNVLHQPPERGPHIQCIFSRIWQGIVPRKTDIVNGDTPQKRSQVMIFILYVLLCVEIDENPKYRPCDIHS